MEAVKAVKAGGRKARTRASRDACRVFHMLFLIPFIYCASLKRNVLLKTINRTRLHRIYDVPRY